MHPLFFGHPDDALYGVYHMPEVVTAAQVGVVLCQPVFHEYMNSRRAMKSLAERFAKAGVHAFRFDYHGTGDSAGDGAELDLDRWIRDIGTAVDEFRASRGITSIGLVGLRLGATLAAEFASRQGDVSFVVLWEPIVKGDPYLRSLRELQDAWVANESTQRPRTRDNVTLDEMFGTPLTAPLAKCLAAVDLRLATSRVAERILIVDESPGEEAQGLARHLAGLDAEVEHRRMDGGQVWNHEVDSAKAQVPREVLTAIVNWVASGTAK